MKQGLRTCLALCLALLGGAAAAADSALDHVRVTYEDGQFTLEAQAWVVGSPAETFARLTDYNHLDALNHTVVESEQLDVETADGNARVRVVSRGCVLVFCRTVRQEQTVAAREHDLVETTFLPDAGDFREGRMTWRLDAELRDGRPGTVIDFDGYLEPAFGLPPAVGPYFARRQMEREIRTTVERLGQLNSAER